MPDGACILDGITFRLWHDPQAGWGWTPHANSYLPSRILYGTAAVSRAEPAHHRVLDWRDWSAGMGAAKVVEGDPNNRLHYSEGPAGASPGRLVQGHEVRTVALTAASGQVSCFFEIASRLYVVNGGEVRQITPTLNAETVAARRADGVGNASSAGLYLSTATFTQASPLWYDATSTKAFLGTSGGATQYVVSFDGAAAAQDNDVLVGYFCLSQGTDGQRLWASSSAADTTGPWLWNLLQGLDPFTLANWSAKFRLGNRSAAITGLAALRNGVIATASDGMVYNFAYATGLPTPLLDSRALVSSATAGRQMGVWNGVLVVPTARGLAWYVEEPTSGLGHFEAIGPHHLVGHEMPVRDACTALYTGDAEWLYAAFYDGTNSWVWAGRRPLPNEQVASRIVWDAVCKVSSQQVTALHVTMLGTNPILCLGTDTPDVRFVTLPRVGLNRAGGNADTNCRSSGTTVQQCYLPDQDSGAPGVPVTAWRLRAKCLGFNSGETVDVFARLDRGSFAQVGTLNTSPFSTITFDPPLRGGSVGLQLQWNGTLNTLYKQIEYLLLDVVEDAEPALTVDVVLHLGARQTILGQEEHYGVAERLQFLRDRVGAPGTFTITDPYGAQFTAKIDNVAGLHQTLVNISADQEPETLVKLRLNLYDDLSGQRGAVWDGVDTYDELVDAPVWDGTV